MNTVALHGAQKMRRDEFYTRYEDIVEELYHYKDKFIGKIVYCNCDNPEKSNFWKYFHINFSKLGLKKLMASFYEPDGSTYYAEYSGGNDKDVTVYDKEFMTTGDFRKAEAQQYIERCDIVVTNPPFPLSVDHMLDALNHGKDFIVLGNINCLGKSLLYPKFISGEIKIGYHFNVAMNFIPNDNYDLGKCGVVENNIVMCKVPAISWFTTFDVDSGRTINPVCAYFPENYPKFDNYDAINVGYLSKIPVDYDGIMGVPITFLAYWDREVYEVVGFRKGDDGKDLRLNGKDMYSRVLIKKK